MTLHLPAVRADGPPLDPTSQQARDWLTSELSKGIYHVEPTWQERLRAWVADLLSRADGTLAFPSWALWVTAALLLVGAAVAIAMVVRRESRSPHPVARSSPVLDEVGVDAATYRRRAAQAGASQDWSAAVLDGYRAITAAAVDRTLLDDLPGRTAHEVALDLASLFPSYQGQLAAASAAFDAVRYGERAGTREAAYAVLTLDDALARSRPAQPQTHQPLGGLL